MRGIVYVTLPWSYAVMRRWLLSVVGPALVLLTPPVRAQDTRADVMAVVQRLFDGMRAGDSAMVRSVFHPKARMISAGSRTGPMVVRVEESPDGFVKAVGSPHPQRWDERTSNEKFFVDGPVAVVWADYTFHLGDKFSHCGIDHFLLVQEAGKWLVMELADTERREGCPA